MKQQPDEDIRPVRWSREALEQLVAHLPGRTELHWGKPDDEGFYTPVIFQHFDPPPPRWWEHPSLPVIVLGFATAGLLVGLMAWMALNR